MSASILQKEVETYQKNLPELLSQEGRFVLIHGEEIVDTYADYEDALKAGYQLFGVDEPFLVKQIHAVEIPHYFTRHLLPVCPS